MCRVDKSIKSIVELKVMVELSGTSWQVAKSGVISFLFVLGTVEYKRAHAASSNGA